MKARKLKSGNWNVRVYDYTDENGKQVYKSFTDDTKAGALYLAAQYKKKPKKANKKEDMSVRQAIERYIDLSDMLSPTTLRGYKIILGNAFSSLMDMKISSLTDEICQQAINIESKRKTAYGRTITAKAVKNEWGLIVPALKLQGYTYNVRLPKVVKVQKELPQPKVVMDAIRGTDVELPCLLAMTMSLRMSEVMGLQFKHIKDGYLNVVQTRHIVDGVETIYPYTKTDASTRRIKLYPRIKEMLPKGKSDDFVVPMKRQLVYKHFKKIMNEVGYDMTFHDLRHMYASIMLNDLGLPAKLVQIEGGWSSPYIMNKIYSNAFTDSQEKMAKAKASYFDNM